MTRSRPWLLAVTVIAVLAIAAFVFWQWNAKRTPEASSGTQSGGPALEGAPDLVANREPLFYCGAEIIEGLGPTSNPYEDIEVVDGASDCYHERASAGQPSELILLMVTFEGDPIMHIRRFMPDGREVLSGTRPKTPPAPWSG